MFCGGIHRLYGFVQELGGIDAHFETDMVSLGQKQLMCLARAMLRKGSILILDEATASIDLETDELVQQIIRTHFSSHTVIAIAHRLQTILDFDRVAVISDGQLAEFDSPTNLLTREPPTMFRALYEVSPGTRAATKKQEGAVDADVPVHGSEEAFGSFPPIAEVDEGNGDETPLIRKPNTISSATKRLSRMPTRRIHRKVSVRRYASVRRNTSTRDRSSTVVMPDEFMEWSRYQRALSIRRRRNEPDFIESPVTPK